MSAEHDQDANPEAGSDDVAHRPLRMDDFFGQDALKENLRDYIFSARKRDEPLDHVLFHGPPGLGKTTLAQIIAGELGVGFRMVAAPAINKPGELASLLVQQERRDVLFIDEIHRLPAPVEELLYVAMEDYKISLMVGDGPQAEPMTLPIQPFTLVGATTRKGGLSRPLQDRFAIPLELQLYSDEDMAVIVARYARLLGLSMDEGAVAMVACRSRGTPRIANGLVRRMRDHATAADVELIDQPFAEASLQRLGVDENGLNQLDRRYLRTLADVFHGGPVGVETLAAQIHDTAETLESSVEPYLMRKGLLARSRRGRVLTDSGRELCGVPGTS